VLLFQLVPFGILVFGGRLLDSRLFLGFGRILAGIVVDLRDGTGLRIVIRIKESTLALKFVSVDGASKLELLACRRRRLGICHNPFVAARAYGVFVLLLVVVVLSRPVALVRGESVALSGLLGFGWNVGGTRSLGRFLRR
jgi:hypothetical protein